MKTSARLFFPDDKPMFLSVNALARHTPWLHAVMLDYATYGVVLFAGLLLVGWWVARSRREETTAAALWAPVGVLLAVAFNQLLVHTFREPRPYAVLSRVLILVHRSSDYAFPSDHAVMAGAVAVGLLLVDRRLGLVAAGMAFLLAFARVYVGAHWPGDVVVGLGVGGGLALVGFFMLRRPGVVLVRALARTRLRPLVVAGSTRASR